MSNQGYAKRLGYNFPIQSTSAEALKIAMIRADELIFKNGWNPLYGSSPKKRLSPQDRYSFICSMAMSIHDELDFLLDYQKIDELIPILYTILQIKDVVKSLGVDFDLEQDVEYDEWGSFTATSRYHNSRIHLLNLLRDQSTPIVSQPREILAIFSSEKISEEFLKTLNKLVNSSDISSNPVKVAIDHSGELLVSDSPIKKEDLKELKDLAGEYRLYTVKT
jgi:hypothetical protein